MFDLEPAIVQWRQEMLAAGIKSPAPLEELESHLREEIEHQIQAGADGAAAFTLAARKMGPPKPLTAEFRKAASVREFLYKRRELLFAVSLTRLVGLLWLALSTPLFFRLAGELFNRPLFDPKTSFAFVIFLSGAVGGTLLLADSRWGRFLVRVNALFFAVLPVVMWMLLNHFAGPSPGLDQRKSHISFWELVAAPGWKFVALGLISILILHLPAKGNLKMTIRI